MKLTGKISWLVSRVQRSLFTHLNQCLPTRLTGQEERLVSILEIVQVEQHVPAAAGINGIRSRRRVKVGRSTFNNPSSNTPSS